MRSNAKKYIPQAAYIFSRGLSAITFPTMAFAGVGSINNIAAASILIAIATPLDFGLVHTEYKKDPSDRRFAPGALINFLLGSFSAFLVANIVGVPLDISIYSPIVMAILLFSNSKMIEAYGKEKVVYIIVASLVIACLRIALVYLPIPSFEIGSMQVILLVLVIVIFASAYSYIQGADANLIAVSLVAGAQAVLERTFGGGADAREIIALNFALQILLQSLTIQNMILVKKVRGSIASNYIFEMILAAVFLALSGVYLWILHIFVLKALLVAGWITLCYLVGSRLFFMFSHQNGTAKILKSGLFGVMVFWVLFLAGAGPATRTAGLSTANAVLLLIFARKR